MSGGERARPSRRAVLASVAGAVPIVAALLNGCDDGSTGSGGSGAANDKPFRLTRPPRRGPRDTARGWPIRIDRSSPTPAVADHVLYCAEYGGLVRAFDAGTGRERWRYTPPAKVLRRDDVNQYTPLPGDGVVVVGRDSSDTSASAVLALDARKGSLLWSRPISNGLALTRWRDLVIYADNSSPPGHGIPAGSVVHAVRARTGKVAWERRGVSVNELIPWGAYLLATYIDENWDTGVRALDPATGRALWHRPVSLNSPGPAPIKAGVLLACHDTPDEPVQLTALRVSDGSMVWEKRYDTLTAGPVVDDPRRLYLSVDNRLLALDVRTGRELWSRTTPFGTLYQCVAHDGMLITGEYTEPTSTDGSATGLRILFLDGDTGELLRSWDHTAAGAQILLAADGMAYVQLAEANGRNRLVGLDTASGKRLWANAMEDGTTLVAQGMAIYTSGTTIDRLHARTGKRAAG